MKYKHSARGRNGHSKRYYTEKLRGSTFIKTEPRSTDVNQHRQGEEIYGISNRTPRRNDVTQCARNQRLFHAAQIPSETSLFTTTHFRDWPFEMLFVEKITFFGLMLLPTSSIVFSFNSPENVYFDGINKERRGINYFIADNTFWRVDMWYCFISNSNQRTVNHVFNS